MSKLSDPNRRMGLYLAAVVGVMVLLSFASVPLYTMFCKVTGYGGTTQVAKQAPGTILNRRLTVRFNTDVAPGLGWQFKSGTAQSETRLGEIKNVVYHVANDSGRNQIGVAVYQVQPERAGLYFNKVQCFCFNQQPLAAGQSAQLPVQFFIDPAFDKDPQMEGVDTITLSYTFFPAKSPRLAQAQKAFEAYEQRLAKSNP
ncbi:MAG: cytochrome c oxidase assembly protein [Proteobacteria bacterium]|nr:cytochrome c oxidase assembly protein [Pseudomonadota bacterium]